MIYINRHVNSGKKNNKIICLGKLSLYLTKGILLTKILQECERDKDIMIKFYCMN